jgi:hypothetical protein
MACQIRGKNEDGSWRLVVVFDFFGFFIQSLLILVLS